MIYKWTDFLLENNNGTRNLSKEEFNQILKTKCSKFNWSDTPIYKSTDAINGEYGFLDVNSVTNYYLHRGKRLRRSAHLYNNIYNILMNHLPSWKKYPKRQVICSTEKINVRYDYTFRVIPFDNSKWGVVPTDDIQGKIPLPKNFINYIDKKIQQNISNFEDLNELPFNHIDTIKDLKIAFEKKSIDINKVNKMLAPERMKFESKIYRQLINYNFPNAKIDLYADQEVPSNEIWTDSNVLLYKVPDGEDDELEVFLNDEMGEGFTRDQAIDYLNDMS